MHRIDAVTPQVSHLFHREGSSKSLSTSSLSVRTEPFGIRAERAAQPGWPELQERETSGCPHAFTTLCLCNPPLQSCCVDVCLVIFPSPDMAGEGGSAQPNWPSSPGHDHSAPFFCCVFRLPLVPAVNHLHHFHSFTDTGQERLEGSKTNSPAFQKYIEKLSMLSINKPSMQLLLHLTLNCFFWELQHQGSGFSNSQVVAFTHYCFRPTVWVELLIPSYC